MAVLTDNEARRICIVMPAFNEAASIGSVIERIRQHVPSADVVVVNDGSTDQTRQQAAARGATVLTLPFNLGIGGAVQTGLKYVYRQRYDIAVEVDADGQHDPVYIPQLIEKIVERGADMAIGSRFIEATAYQSSWLRLAGIRIFSRLIKLVTGVRIFDSTSGYRAYGRDALAFLSRRYPTDFPEPESIVMLLNAGFTVREVPMLMNERQTGQSVLGKSDFSFRAAYFVLSNAIAILVGGLKGKRRYAR
jgi:glycosyltransferase involved in cell wall biosynthesis